MGCFLRNGLYIFIAERKTGKDFGMGRSRRMILALSAVMAAICFSSCRIAEIRQIPSVADVATPAAYILLFENPAKGEIFVYGDAGLADFRFPPCSTFKIVSTLMGLDGGGLADLNARLGYDGTKYEYDTWNRDLTLSEAFRFSCVPYYKKLTGRLEKTYVQEVLGRLGYGNRDISVWNSNGHNVFWIESSLLISPREQLRVLERIFSGRSGFSQRHVALLKECMRYESIGKIGFYGKTGTGRNHNTNRLEAWCVGFLEYPDGGIVYYAAHGADRKRDVLSSEIRDSIRQIVSKGQGGAASGNGNG